VSVKIEENNAGSLVCVLLVYRRDSAGREEEGRDRRTREERRVKVGQGKVVDVETWRSRQGKEKIK
jgi:hypothetical protein